MHANILYFCSIQQHTCSNTAFLINLQVRVQIGAEIVAN